MLRFFYNISFDFAPFETCFHTDFGICWSFLSIIANYPRNTCQNRPISWTFFRYVVKSPTFASFAGTKKTMIVITIAFVSCLVWVCLRLPDANAPLLWLRSGMERYAGRKLSLCCQFFVSGFVGLLTYLFMCGGFSLAQTHCFSLLSEP